MYNIWRTSVEFRRSDFKSCGERVIVSPRCNIQCPDRIEIADEVYINEGCSLAGSGSLKIGKGVVFGPNVTVLTGDHQYDLPDLRSFPFDERYLAGDVTIGEFAWLGAHSVILPGVKLGHACVVGAGCIVTKDVEDYAVVVGNPARVIKYRSNRDVETSQSWVARMKGSDRFIVR